ncbi:MAG: MATE family efflux transporter [Lachnospiraceae bacterium]|jgi:putative MATE family efflux protein|nr:MATE family efflux transporter [Lachnospiraceae bacterium]
MLYSNKDLKKLIFPLVVEQFLGLLVGMVDVMMLAGVGEAAVSGVSMVDTINILVINISAAMATGGAVVVGHFIGQKNPENAGRAAWQLLYFAGIMSTVVSVFFIAGHQLMLQTIFGEVETAVMESAATYLIITAVSVMPLTIYNSGCALFRAMNDSRTTMWVSLLMNLVNIGGNALLIFVFKMGVAGAAIATSVSRTLAAVIIFAMLFNDKRSINIRHRATWRLKREYLGKMLRIGIPNGMENSLFQLGKILLLSLISTFGTAALAANAVGATLAGFNLLPPLAINLAQLSVISVCIGAGDFKQARYYTKKLLAIAIAATAVISVFLFILAPVFLRAYNLSAEAERMAIEIIRFHAVMAVLLWIPSFSLPNTLRAAGDVVWPMVVAIVSMWLFRIVASYVLGRYLGLGLMGVWIAMTIDWGFRSLCYVLRYRSNKWVNIMKRRSTNH